MNITHPNDFHINDPCKTTAQRNYWIWKRYLKYSTTGSIIWTPPRQRKWCKNCAWNLEHDKYVLRVFSLYNLCIQISFSEIMPMTFLTLNRSSCSPFINISRNSLYHLSNSIALLSFHQYIQKLTLPPFLQQLVFTAAMKWTIKMFFSNHYTLTYSQHLSSPFLCNIYLSSPFPIGHLHHYTA